MNIVSHHSILKDLGFGFQVQTFREDNFTQIYDTWERWVDFRCYTIWIRAWDNCVTLRSHPMLSVKEGGKLQHYFTGWINSPVELLKLIEQVRWPIFTHEQYMALDTTIKVTEHQAALARVCYEDYLNPIREHH